MPRDDARSHLTQQWLRKANEDAYVAELAFDTGKLWGIVAFHAQQAAEKALKAFLSWHDIPFRKTHNLVALVEQCSAIARTLPPSARLPRSSPNSRLIRGVQG